MQAPSIAPFPGAPSLPRRGVFAQIGRGLLAVTLMLQGLASLFGGLAALWAGTFAWDPSSTIPGGPRYESVAAEIFLVLAGGALLVSLGAFTANARSARADRLIGFSLWVVIVIDLLFPLSLLTLGVVTPPVIQSDPYLLPSWAFWQVLFGLPAFGVWIIARKPPFGWIGISAFAGIGTVCIVLVAAVVVGAHEEANAFSAYIRANGRIAVCASQPDSCWRPVDAATTQQAATSFGAKVAWIPEGQGVTPTFIRRESSVVVESARLNGHTVLDLISDAKRFPLCPPSECPSGTILELHHTRVWIYSRPDGGLNMAWARGGRSYRLYVYSYDTRLTQGQGVSLFGQVRYAEPISGSVPLVARRLYGYWKVNDRAGAQVVASRRAIAQLFSTPWEAKYLPPSRCTVHSTGGFDCDSSRVGAYLSFLVARRPGASGYWVLNALACSYNPCYFVGTG